LTAGRKVNTSSIHWNTPQKYVRAVKEVMPIIELDPCSNEMSIVGARHNEYVDGLGLDWNKFNTIYVNPPYGRGISEWLRKCANCCGDVIALIPVATNTRHWKDYVFQADVICFLGDTRLKFMIDGTTNNKGASMACCAVYWGKDPKKFIGVFAQYGRCMKAI